MRASASRREGRTAASESYFVSYRCTEDLDSYRTDPDTFAENHPDASVLTCTTATEHSSKLKHTHKGRYFTRFARFLKRLTRGRQLLEKTRKQVGEHQKRFSNFKLNPRKTSKKVNRTRICHKHVMTVTRKKQQQKQAVVQNKHALYSSLVLPFIQAA